MLEAITQLEFVAHFESVFFSAGTARIDIEYMADTHKEEQITEKEKNKEHPMFLGKTRESVVKGDWYENIWM
jgi:hypothetical protein